MKKDPYRVNAFWDDHAKVWSATSGDIPGLVTESVTLDDLSAKLMNMIPELLRLNHICDESTAHDISIELNSQRKDLIQIAS